MYHIMFFIFFTLLQNNDFEISNIETKNIYVDSSIDTTLLNFVEPYSLVINSQMNQIISYSKYDLKKGQPTSLLGNWVSDLCLEVCQKKFNDSIDMVIFNNGGLRNDILKGNITKRHIYQLMPFENKLVILSLNHEEINKLFSYLNETGGQPVSFSKHFNKNEMPFYVLTTDYLANGGDNMIFFKNIEQFNLNEKMRDVIINYCISKDTIISKYDKREKYFLKHD